MDTKSGDTQDEATGGTKPDGTSSGSSETPPPPPPPAKPEAPEFESHGPTCESCDEAAAQTDPPVTSTKPFRRGFCSNHSKDTPKRAVEVWATKHKMLPRILEQGAVRKGGTLRPARQNPKHADFHRARAFKSWPRGAECTEEEFLAAVKESATPTFR